MNTNVKQQFAEALSATGIDLQRAPAEIAEKAAESAARLTLAANELGFAEAVEAESQRVWLFAASRAVRSADAVDARAFGLIHGFLIAAAGGV